jgi:hypothetical protein
VTARHDDDGITVGGALAVTSAAIVFDAPGRLSTTKGCLSASVSFSPSMRATMSVPPPAGAPTISRTGLDGNVSCARGAAANATSARMASAMRTTPRRIEAAIGLLPSFPSLETQCLVGALKAGPGLVRKQEYSRLCWQRFNRIDKGYAQ